MFDLIAELARTMILLTCSTCSREQLEMRQEYDPPLAIELNFLKCDRCNSGDFEMLSYYDANGHEVMEA